MPLEVLDAILLEAEREPSKQLTQKFVAWLNGSRSTSWLKIVKDSPCIDCGSSYPPECMDFDHVRGVKKFNIGWSIHHQPFKEILEEIEKCELVCANCHRIRTRKRKLKISLDSRLNP
jgi:hypothetical protein